MLSPEEVKGGKENVPEDGRNGVMLKGIQPVGLSSSPCQERWQHLEARWWLPLSQHDNRTWPQPPSHHGRCYLQSERGMDFRQARLLNGYCKSSLTSKISQKQPSSCPLEHIPSITLALAFVTLVLTFCQLMDSILGDQDFCTCYTDILIFSRNLQVTSSTYELSSIDFMTTEFWSSLTNVPSKYQKFNSLATTSLHQVYAPLNQRSTLLLISHALQWWSNHKNSWGWSIIITVSSSTSPTSWHLCVQPWSGNSRPSCEDAGGGSLH